MQCCCCTEHFYREKRIAKWSFRETAKQERQDPIIMDCDKCKYKMLCIVDPECDRTFESK